MDFNKDVRKNQLDSINQFIFTSQNTLKSIFDTLGWSKLNDEPKSLKVCPYNSGHKIPASKFEDHLEKCYTKCLGYNKDDQLLSEPSSNNSSIKLNPIEKIHVLTEAHTKVPFFQSAWNGQDPDPQTSDRLLSTFSRDERLAIYDYCISKTTGPETPPEYDTTFSKNERNASTYSNEELKSFERDIKRRSVKYKSVHTSNKNYKEILAEVIDSQMKEYVEWIADSKKNKHLDKSGTSSKSVKSSKTERIELLNSPISKASTNSEKSFKRNLSKSPIHLEVESPDSPKISSKSYKFKNSRDNIDYRSEYRRSRSKNSISRKNYVPKSRYRSRSDRRSHSRENRSKSR